MSRGGGKSGRSVTPEEAELWNRLAPSVDKIKTKQRVQSHAAAPSGPPAPSAPLRGPSTPAKTKAVVVKPPSAAPKTARVPPLADFDRRASRQVAAGKLTIDARLDLHGVRRRDARAQLQAFLFGAQERGCKTVLVITGKGQETDHRDYLAGALGEPQRGVLRQLVPQWLGEHELRSIVLSYTTAGVRHGGSGALYVQLRKATR
jgi:DNA-nicking Smr family endonuclease